MTETIQSPDAAATSAAPKKRSGGLNGMLLADLKAMAGGMGIAGASGMKKAQLVEAIKAAQSERGQSQKAQAQKAQPQAEQAPKAEPQAEQAPKSEPQQAEKQAAARSEDRSEDRGRDQRREPDQQDKKDKKDKKDQPKQDQSKKDRQERPDRPERTDGGKGEGGRDDQRDQQSGQRQGRQGGQPQGGQGQGGQSQGGQSQGGQPQGGQRSDRAEDGEGSRRNRRRRGRDRTSTRTPGRGEPDTEVREDDVLVPAAGILDVLDNYAFVRTSGYLPGPEDVYLSLSMVRKYGLRRGDAITGQVRQPREGERREKFNPMVRIDSVNGADPESARSRVEFSKLTPLYPSERLRLETDPHNLIGRVIDIAAPIGKGQRGLIVSPAKAGKTMVMQSIANSITTNNPECHLMVVLVDERPEEVTDFERSVKGEVISSTFDRPASDHTTVAELAIERAKRLVELGHDVVVLLDGITRLGRAYNLAAPASGRILSGGVDSAALYPPKRFFGAARNIENGGSLTILATALIESGSKMDEVIFEEFKGTGNMEIRLRRDFADKRLFPAIDAVQSGTRREELLMSKEEMAIVWKLRRVLSALDGQQALELLLERLKKSHSNIEFLMQVQKTTPMAGGED